jgi:hypothetical protein
MHPLLLKAGIGAAALAAGGGFAVFGSSSPAVAYSSPPLTLDISIQSPATLVAHGAAVNVPVTVTCPYGTDASVYISLSEKVGNKTASGTNSVDVGCTGSRETILVTVPSQNGLAFAKGSAFAQGEIFACSYYFCGDETDSATITINK